jgi:hypothetical protein
VRGIADRQRLNAATASIPRLQDRHPIAGARELARGHQTGGARADDDDVLWMRSGHLDSGLARIGSRVLKPIAQQDRAAFQDLAALQRHRGEGSALVGCRFRGIENAWRALRAVHRRANDQVELVDKACPEKGAIDAAASLQQQPLHAELAMEDV